MIVTLTQQAALANLMQLELKESPVSMLSHVAPKKADLNLSKEMF